MSDHRLRLIPTEPAFVPTDAAARDALHILTSHVKEADGVRTTTQPHVIFVDCGSNLERIACPRCSADLSSSWWVAAVNEAYQSRFADLHCGLPCCGLTMSLNDLTYECPVGFARFVLEVVNPGVLHLLDEAIAQLEATLGCDLRAIWAHL